MGERLITEIAELDVKAGSESDFESAMRQVKTLLETAAGFLEFQLLRSIESPHRSRLVAKWRTLESHTVDFYNSTAFQELRLLIGPYFVERPRVEHHEAII